MNQGGVVDTLTQLLPTVGMVGQLGSAALGIVNMINENRQNKIAQSQQNYMATTNQYRGFQMGGAVDNQLSNTSVEVQGNPGIDTNPRMVANSAINVTEGEVINNNVNMGMDNSAFVFSDDRAMRDPANGKTFAKSVKKYEKAKGRAEKRLERYPYDNEAKNAIMFNQRMIDQTAQRQEETKSMLGIENDLAAFNSQEGMRYGGKVNYKQGGQVDPTNPKSRQRAMEEEMYYNRYNNGFNTLQLLTGFPRAPMPKMGMGPTYGSPIDPIGYQNEESPVLREYNNNQAMRTKLRRLSIEDAGGPFGDISGMSYNIPASSQRPNRRMGGRVNYVNGGPLGGNPTLTNLTPEQQLQQANARGTRINYGTTSTVTPVSPVSPVAPTTATTTPGLNPITSGLQLLGQRAAGVSNQNRTTGAQQSIANLNSAMGTTPAAQTRQTNPGFSTLGDYVYMAGKTAELIGKARLARQPIDTYNRGDFEVSAPIFNPARDQRTINDMVRAQTMNINTGNANLDRALASTMYAQGMDKNAQIAEKYRQMQATTDTSVAQANVATALNIADRNENNRAAKFNAQDALLTSVGTYGQAIQDMSNTRASNRVNLEAINQMSQMYNISPENLLNIMRNNPAIRKQLQDMVQLRSRG
jgi:hypothetical protein